MSRPLLPGDDVAVVGLGSDFRMLSQSSEVANVSAAAFPLSRTLRFRDTNLDVVTLVNGPSEFDGTLVDLQGRVLGMWASFAYQSGRDLTQVNLGIQSDVILDMMDKLRAGEPLRSLEVGVGADAARDGAQGGPARRLAAALRGAQPREARGADRRDDRGRLTGRRGSSAPATSCSASTASSRTRSAKSSATRSSRPSRSRCCAMGAR